MDTVVELNLVNFSLIYLLLLIVLGIMKKSRLSQTSEMLIASIRMSVQLLLAGLLLTYLFKNPNAIIICSYIVAMISFAIYRVFKVTRIKSRRFKGIIILSMCFSSLFVILFLIIVVIEKNVLEPRYLIPISGMVVGNSMTGITLGIKSFEETMISGKNQIEALLNFGVDPKKILIPFVNKSLETALLPTMNSMIGMGIVSLPGMMTGQILAGTVPMTAIFYQIAIMIAISASVCLTVFLTLNFGYRTFINSKSQILFIISRKGEKKDE